jgi:hypothetical protein
VWWSVSSWWIYFLAENSLSVAAKEVAKVIGGDIQQTESELLNKLLSPSQIANENEKGEQKLSMNLRWDQLNVHSSNTLTCLNQVLKDQITKTFILLIFYRLLKCLKQVIITKYKCQYWRICLCVIDGQHYFHAALLMIPQTAEI